MNNPPDDDTQADMPDIQVVAATAIISDTAETVLSDLDMRRQLIAQKLFDAQTPGFQAEFDPEEAELLGAFTEDALSELEALDSSIDQPDSFNGGQ